MERTKRSRKGKEARTGVKEGKALRRATHDEVVCLLSSITRRVKILSILFPERIDKSGQPGSAFVPPPSSHNHFLPLSRFLPASPPSHK